MLYTCYNNYDNNHDINHNIDYKTAPNNPLC